MTYGLHPRAQVDVIEDLLRAGAPLDSEHQEQTAIEIYEGDLEEMAKEVRGYKYEPNDCR